MFLAIVLSFIAAFSPVVSNANIHQQNGFIDGVFVDEYDGEKYMSIWSEDGNGWVAYYENGFEVGDRVLVVYNTLGTLDIYDDEIIAVLPR